MTPTLIAWADVEGRGFAPVRTPDTASSAAPEFWAAAERLIDDDAVAQPAVRSTLDHPVYSLRVVTVARRGPHWCFAEQGRGGPFGVAGTCRFQFLPFELPAHLAWSEGIAAVGGKEPLTAGRADEAAVRHVLGGLLLGRPLLRMPGTPAEAAVTVFAVLGVLPGAVAAGYAWSTCPLQEPRPNLVTADLPAEFRTGSPLQRVVDRARWSAADDADAVLRRLAPPAHRSAFDLLVNLAVHLETDHDLAGAPVESLQELVEHAAATRMFPTPQDVPAMLRDGEGRRRLARFPAVLTQWAARHERAALAALTGVGGVREPALRAVILAALLDQLLDGSLLDRGKPAADLVREAMPGAGQLAAHLRAHRGDGTLTLPDPWLQQLGISPWEHHDLYTDPTPHVVTELTRAGVTTRAREVLHARGPLFARHVLTEMRGRSLVPATAAALLTAAAQPAEGTALDDGDLQRLGPQLLARADDRRGEAWLVELCAAARESQAPGYAVRMALYGATAELLQRDRLRNPRLLALLRGALAVSEREGEPVPVAVQRALGPAAPARTAVYGTPAARRALAGLSPQRREKLVRAGTVAAAAAALLGVTVWVAVKGGEQDPGRPAASGTPAPAVAAATSAAQPALQAQTLSLKPAEKGNVVGAVQDWLHGHQPRRVVYVLVKAGSGAEDLCGELLQLPELGKAQCLIVDAGTSSRSATAEVELTFVTGPGDR